MPDPNLSQLDKFKEAARDLECDFGRRDRRTTRDWWSGLPTWLKLVYVFVSTPAWLYIFSCVLTGENKSTGAMVAFGIFALTAGLFIIFDRRRGSAD